jgi:hypothetical protein
MLNFQRGFSQNRRSCNFFMHSRRLLRFNIPLFHSKSRTTARTMKQLWWLVWKLKFFFTLFKGFPGSDQYLHHYVFALYSVRICFWQYLLPFLLLGILYSFFFCSAKSVKTNVVLLSSIHIRYVLITTNTCHSFSKSFIFNYYLPGRLPVLMYAQGIVFFIFTLLIYMLIPLMKTGICRAIEPKPLNPAYP